MDIIIWIIVGALAGWIASMIMKADGQMGPLANIVVGILGAFIGGFLYQTLFGGTVGGFNLTNLIVAIIGAVILLAIVKAFSGNRVHA